VVYVQCVTAPDAAQVATPVTAVTRKLGTADRRQAGR
jgi:hypothetical protein